MNWTVVLDLGSGNCEQGFPHITAQLWQAEHLNRMQFIGALPPVPALSKLYRQWQPLHQWVNSKPQDLKPFQDQTGAQLSSGSQDKPQTHKIPSESAGLRVAATDYQSPTRLTPKLVIARNDRHADFKDLCQQLQIQLNQWFDADSFRKIDEQLRTRLSPADHIHVIIETQDLTLQRIPWHLWRFFDHYPNAEVALGTQEYEPITPRHQTLRHQIRILAILGNSEGINLDRDRKLLEQLPHSDIVFLEEPHRQTLDQWLWQEPGWDILFFAGHSASLKQGATGIISLNPSCDLTISELKHALTAAVDRGLKLAIFNSCDGLGVAREMASLNLPQLIVMREPVPDLVAQEFLKNWLQAFSQGMPFYRAVRTAREQLQGWEDMFPGASWLPVACQNPAVTPVTWQSLIGHPPSSPVPAAGRQAYRNRQVLLNKVHHYWIHGVLEQSLPGQTLMEIGLERQPTSLTNPWNLGQVTSLASPDLLPAGTSILDCFDQLGVGRTLLILGEPGAGKTTALLTLTRTLLARAEDDPDQLIPVVLNLSSWAGPTQDIVGWLGQELKVKYQVPQRISQNWIDDQQLLFLLDGLDEVRADQREACIAALNQFSQDHGPEIVICCRAKEYDACSEKLLVQAAIALQPLTLTQINQWLEAVGNKIEGLEAAQAAISTDQTLKELARSPLMLSIMTSASQSIEMTDLPTTDQVEDRRHQLFSAYIQHMFRHRGADRQWSPTQTIRWLSWLAQRMTQTSQSVFSIEGLQVSWLPPAVQHWYGFGVRLILGWLAGVFHLALLVGLYEGVRGLIYGSIGGICAGFAYGAFGTVISDRFQGFKARATHGLTLGLIMGLNYGIIQTLIHGWSKGLLCGTTYGLTYTLSGGVIYGFINRPIEPADRIQWSWPKARRGAILGLILGAVLTLTNRPTYGLMFGLIMGLILSFDRCSEVEAATLSNQGIWRSLTNAITLTVTIGGISGIVLSLMEATVMRQLPADPIVFGVVNGVIFGMISGLLGGQGSGIVCIKHFVLRLLLWWTHCIPWNYAKFLDYATTRIFLKKVGGSYVFVHRLLLEHFAKL